MATDFSKQGNAVNVTDGTAQIKAFVNQPVSYSFDAAGTTLTVQIGRATVYDVALADLRVAGAGAAPANVAAAYLALASVFGNYP